MRLARKVIAEPEPILCGYCKLDYAEHPVIHCLYTYIPILDSHGVIVGYKMIDSPIGAVNGTNQPSP